MLWTVADSEAPTVLQRECDEVIARGSHVGAVTMNPPTGGRSFGTPKFFLDVWPRQSISTTTVIPASCGMIVPRFDCRASRGDAFSTTNAAQKNGTLGNELERGIFWPRLPVV